MRDRRVRVIDVVIERESGGMATATSDALPGFFLATTQSRLDRDIPDALVRFFEMAGATQVEVLPVEADDDDVSLMQWAAILSRSSTGGVAAR